MKVKATRLGFYGYLRRKPGAVFALSDPKHFSEKWMEKVEDDTPVTPAWEPPLDAVGVPTGSVKEEVVKRRGPGRPKKSTGDVAVL